jgi:hypothetical protein
MSRRNCRCRRAVEKRSSPGGSGEQRSVCAGSAEGGKEPTSDEWIHGEHTTRGYKYHSLSVIVTILMLKLSLSYLSAHDVHHSLIT